MSMHAMRAMHSMSRRDSSVLQRQLPPGTWRRVFRFARPYRWQLVIFLVIIVLDALIGVLTPVLAGRVVNEITAHGEVRVSRRTNSRLFSKITGASLSRVATW